MSDYALKGEDAGYTKWPVYVITAGNTAKL